MIFRIFVSREVKGCFQVQVPADLIAEISVENVILQNLIKSNEWLSVAFTLTALYPDQAGSIEAYREVFLKLREMTPAESDIQIVLEQCFDDETDEKSYVDVSGKELTAGHSGLKESLAIEFVPWAEWLGMSIDKETLKAFNELEIISHCLVEMTFAGFEEEEIQEQYSALKKTVDEFRNMTEEDKRANIQSLDDLLDELDDE